MVVKAELYKKIRINNINITFEPDKSAIQFKHLTDNNILLLHTDSNNHTTKTPLTLGSTSVPDIIEKIMKP